MPAQDHVRRAEQPFENGDEMTQDRGRALRILIMAAEMVPFAKTGQVAEVISSLAQALHALGHDVRVAMPHYSHIDPERFGLERIMEPFSVPMDHRRDLATVHRTTVGSDVPVYMIDNPRYFGENVTSVYAASGVYDADPFIFYPRATLEMLKRPEVGWQPDIIHCHDWQTAIVPNWMATIYKDDAFYSKTAIVFTIHRLSHQGIFGYRVLEVAGIQEYGFLYHSGITDLSEMVDLMGRGIYYADAVTTVSERYAQEIRTPEFGEWLDPLLRDRSDHLFGVLNGIDTVSFDPATDPHISSHYGTDTLERRSANKRALQRLFGLEESPDPDMSKRANPIIGMISRLTDAKGFDLLTAVFETIMANLGVQFAILGVGEPEYHDLLSELVQRFPGRMGLQLTFDEKMERQIYAGSDMFLMPSYVEPCGLGQMIAMRYGSVPIVRATGGLADTVQDYDPATRRGNGFSFTAYDEMALYTAIVRAVETYKHHDIWLALQQHCMALDFSWSASAAKYVDIYRWAQRAHKRRPGQNSGWVG